MVACKLISLDLYFLVIWTLTDQVGFELRERVFDQDLLTTFERFSVNNQRIKGIQKHDYNHSPQPLYYQIFNFYFPWAIEHIFQLLIKNPNCLIYNELNYYNNTTSPLGTISRLKSTITMCRVHLPLQSYSYA